MIQTIISLTTSSTLQVRASDDVVRVRQEVRAKAVALEFSLVGQTKIVTAASELARNALDYGGGGEVRIETLQKGAARGLRLTFEDKGAGIENIEQALTDGFTTGRGLGIGLGGARRLSDEFEIHSVVGQGTRIVIARWK
ncbi:MAG: anti-sigma regulatory factor [Sphingomonadales bacterium]|nr:anti-sigma regulatory factor [Sphingomonadales bacterium]